MTRRVHNRRHGDRRKRSVHPTKRFGTHDPSVLSPRLPTPAERDEATPLGTSAVPRTGRYRRFPEKYLRRSKYMPGKGAR